MAVFSNDHLFFGVNIFRRYTLGSRLFVFIEKIFDLKIFLQVNFKLLKYIAMNSSEKKNDSILFIDIDTQRKLECLFIIKAPGVEFVFF